MTARLAFLVFCFVAHVLAAATPRLTGIMTVSGRTYLAITDESGSHAEWVGVGDSYREFVFEAFDPLREIAQLRSAGTVVELRLNGNFIRTVELQRLSGLMLARELAEAGDVELTKLFRDLRALSKEVQTQRLAVRTAQLNKRTFSGGDKVLSVYGAIRLDALERRVKAIHSELASLAQRKRDQLLSAKT